MKQLFAFVLTCPVALRIKRMAVSSVALLFIALYAANAPASTCFDDEQLHQLKASSAQRGTLIYVWSPRMVYSVQNMAMASRAAAAAGLDFVALHDMRVPRNEWPMPHASSKRMPDLIDAAPTRPAVAFTPLEIDALDLATPPYFSLTDTSRPLCAAQLIEREALRHFPTAFVITARGVHPHPVVGAMPWSAWVSSLDQRLRQP